MADLGAIGYMTLPDGNVPAKKFTGTVTVIGGAGADVLGGRMLALHHQATGELISRIYSKQDGTFAIASNVVVQSEPHYLVLLDDTAGSQFNAQVFGDIYPV